MSVTSDRTAPEATGSRPGPRPSDADPGAGPPPIVFVGGTGRSGTHVVARLLGEHSRFADVPIECRFHTNPQGFPDLLAGRVTPDQFVRKMRRFWWHRIRAGEPLAAVLPGLPLGREVRGLHKVVPRERFDAALTRFEDAYPDDLDSACRELFLDLLWPLAEEREKPGLVEMSCFTIAAAPSLLRLFPEARLVHSVRDGRDAGVSKVGKRQKRGHPTDAIEGIDWWYGRLAEAERGAAVAPPGKLFELSLDELAWGDRAGAYTTLLEFLGIEDEPPMREFFDREVSAENANRRRWRAGLSEGARREVVEHYERTLERIEGAGFASAPLLRRVYEQDR
jgi:Sulfotransferase family